MKNFKVWLSFLLAMLMIVGVFASCGTNGNQSAESTTAGSANTETEASNEATASESTESTTTEETQVTTEESTNETTATTDTQVESNTSSTEESTENNSETTESQGTETTETEETQLKGTNEELINNAQNLADAVNSYFEDASREHFVMENNNTIMRYSLKSYNFQGFSSVTDKNGNTYIQDTMVAFVTKKDGSTHYSSNSNASTESNIYRFGYYYFENRLEGEVLMNNDSSAISETKIALDSYYSPIDIKDTYSKGVLTLRVLDATDPRIYYDVKSDDCNFLKITMRADLSSTSKTSFTFFFRYDSETGYQSDIQTTLNLVNDGEFHTYYIPLASLPGFTGSIYAFRLDPNGNKGDTYQINEISFEKRNTGDVLLARAVHMYSDKVHQTLQFAVTNEVNDIAELGMLTNIAKDTVAKVIVKDKNGIHESFDDVHWSSAEYVGFDIIGAGIFGYILPVDRLSGKIVVTEEDGNYVIKQYATPVGYTITPSPSGSLNANDYFMGQRIYTDGSHDFKEFLKEAYCERNPLTDKNIVVNESQSESGVFLGYDSLRGIYKLGVKAIGFIGAFETYPQRHFNVNFTVTGDDVDRKFYIMTYSDTQGCLESAVILNEKNMLIPIPVEVGKNFRGDGEANIFNVDDDKYSEAIIPMLAGKGTTQELTIVNLYQKWGQYDLKQISWIQFYCPFYHFSTGTTETNCIRQMFDTKGGRELMYLPDHRAWSAPFWHLMDIGNNQPQHTNGGHHYFLQYTDADGNYNAIEFVNDVITSHGPTYAEIKMDYITDDRKMEVSHTHMEMPQSDENRGYYTIEYTVLEDISFTDFKQNFSIYSVREKGTGSYYRNIGYLDENNQHAIVDSLAQTNAVEDGTAVSYKLGNIAPYFTFFNIPDSAVFENGVYGYVNVSFIIASTEITINGEAYEPEFLIYNEKIDGSVYLRLTLDLDDIVLKAGDTFKMNAIIMPWGSHLLNGKYDDIINAETGEVFGAKNVRDVRENSVLDPFKATALNNCEVIESAFLPKVKTTNGKSAEFTISGGENNTAVRVYGFDTLTVPKFEELVDGNWVEYVVSSINTPDSAGYGHHYDGYMVHYDEDGTYSYSFVTTITDGAARTFRITADGEFEGFPDELVVKQDAYHEEGDYKYFWNPELLEESAIDNLVKFGGAVNNSDYISFFGNPAYKEAYINPLEQGSKVSGQYLIIKYRFPETNKTIAPNSIEIFTSTTNEEPTAEDGFYAPVTADGEWHVIIINLAETKSNTFTAAADGNYYAKYLRLDVINQVTPTTDCIDIAYVAMFTDYDNVIAYEKDMKFVTYVAGGLTTNIDPTTGEEYELKYNRNENYHDSTVAHGSCLEALNGKQLAGGLGGSTLKGPEIVTLNSTTLNNSLVFISGWTVVEGGFSKIVWSADGGLTWNDVTLYRLAKYNNGSTAHIGVAEGRLNNEYTFVDPVASYTGIAYQGKRLPYYHEECAGVAADLTAYIGQTVDVTFAAIPNSDPNGLCYIAHVTKVKVVEPGVSEEEPEEADPYNATSSGFVKSKVAHATCLDGVNGLKLGGGLGGNSNKGPEVIAHNNTTVGDSKLVISGWTVVEGGFDRIVWSADGGKTWNTAEFYGRDNFGNGSTAHIEVAEGRLSGSYVFADPTNSYKGCTYQGTVGSSYTASTHGVAADLSAYAGQTVNVTFAAVPKGQPNSLCYIAHLTGVQVPAAQ